jgi:hypothetical protein
MKSPCEDCVVRAMCSHKHTVLCEILANYISPSYLLVIRVRFLRTKKFLPNLKYIRRGKGGHWLNVPADLIRS